MKLYFAWLNAVNDDKLRSSSKLSNAKINLSNIKDKFKHKNCLFLSQSYLD